MDIYLFIDRKNQNYYSGFLYQFYQSKWLDLSTAVGIRKYSSKNTTHLFIPQLLYTIHLTEKVSIGGSFVDIRNYDSMIKKGTALDVFFMFKIFEVKIL